MFPNKTALAFPSFCHHHLSLFGHNTGETTNMSNREETKRGALVVGTPLRLNRLEGSTFSWQKRIICASSIDSNVFFSAKSTPINLSDGKRRLTTNVAE
jgi:hypothetical protein